MNGITKIMALSLITLVLVLMSSLKSHAAVSSPDSLVYSFHFRLGDDLLMKDYRENKRNFDAMEQWMTAENIVRISNIKIVGTASPEGVLEFNNLLSLKRAEAVRKYILYRWKTINKQTVIASQHTDYLSAWVLAIQNDPSVPHREKVLEILNTNASIQTKWANIQLLTGGASQYIRKSVFPQLRNAVACVITFKESKSPAEKVVQHEVSSAAIGERAIEKVVAQNETIKITTDHAVVEKVATVVAIEEETKNSRPTTDTKEVVEDKNLALSKEPKGAKCAIDYRFAIKTNLLFNALTAINVELEVPIGQRWSVAGELIFPWWLNNDKQHCLQLLNGNLEGRYWLGNRSKYSVMTGWFAGLYAGGGYYDVERNTKGYQGEFFIAGLSGGYSHAINRSGSLRMEYSLGIGFMKTKYRQYKAEWDNDEKWHLYREATGNYTWFGPTRLKVSLVWMLYSNKKGGAK